MPYLLTGSPKNLRLRYFVPDFANLISISSISVTVDVYDDGDSSNNEQVDLRFVLNGVGLPNLILDSHTAGLNGTDSVTRQTLSG